MVENKEAKFLWGEFNLPLLFKPLLNIKKENLRKKRQLRELEVTKDEQWERINIILLIFALVLLVNTTLILIITLRFSNAMKTSTLKHRYYFVQEVTGKGCFLQARPLRLGRLGSAA